MQEIGGLRLWIRTARENYVEGKRKRDREKYGEEKSIHYVFGGYSDEGQMFARILAEPEQELARAEVAPSDRC